MKKVLLQAESMLVDGKTRISPSSEYSLEASLRLTEEGSDGRRVGEVIVVGLDDCNVTVLRTLLGTGADRAILFEGAVGDERARAFALKTIIDEEQPDAVFVHSIEMGRPLARAMGCELVTDVVGLVGDSDGVEVESLEDGSSQTRRVQLPFIAIVRSEVTRPRATFSDSSHRRASAPYQDGVRFASLRALIRATKKPLETRQTPLGFLADDSALSARGSQQGASLHDPKYVVVVDGTTGARGTLPGAAEAISIEIARSNLRFPHGHPLPGCAYAQHPLKPSFYFPVADYERAIFLDRVNELILLLARLGATRVRVSCKQDESSAAQGEVRAAKVASAKVRANYESTEGKRADIEETFRPKGDPHIPEGLVWFAFEPAWQALAERRLALGTTSFRMEFAFGDSLAISAGVKVGFEHLGLKVGGGYQSYANTIWECEGEFA